jgi:hypothetical protein
LLGVEECNKWRDNFLNAISLKLTPSQPLKIWGEVRFDFKLKVNIIPLNGSIKLEWQIAQLHDSHAVNVE